jgi:serine/threonine protein phosphatase PrpC
MAYGTTDPGVRRSSNQDALGCHSEAGLYLVADGVGGGPAGEIASALAVSAAREVVAAAGADQGASGPRALLRKAAQYANERILAAAREDPSTRGMATSLSGLLLRERETHVAHVGDCRIYRWRRGEPLRRLTRDHSRVQGLVDRGLLTEEQAAQHPWSHQLERVLGLEGPVEVDLSSEPRRAVDRFLLCSDGLIRVVREAEIAEVLGGALPTRRQVEYLVALARERGAPDNVTVIAVHGR